MPRIRLLLRGTVQGVGLRPHVLRVGIECRLSGFVCNSGGQVEVQAQGARPSLARFVELLRQIAPPAELKDVERTELPERADEAGFRILQSSARALVPALPPDLAPCAECVAEIEAPDGRRASYPFTACTRCGARYSIVQALPYDRAATTLHAFPPCAACQSEYADVADRRFHAQAIACPSCGPTLELLDGRGERLARGPEAIERAAAALAEGRIVALKGVGGFQLLVDALNDAAVGRLRARKRREQKPFAVLFADVAAADEQASLSEAERALLSAPEAPIVLAERRVGQGRGLADAVAPDNPQLGCLLPASPLHRLLATAVARPLVCTSGNSSGEPLCTETADAVARLAAIADLFLVHDRVIARPLDDSVARAGPGGVTLLRRGRGYAPRVVANLASRVSVLALGAELKAAPALLLEGALVLGQHVGDLGEARTLSVFERNTSDLQHFFQAKPDFVACDLHPDYASTRHAEKLAKELGAPLVRVQHHHAHIAGVAAEHGLSGPVLGVAWDGTGFGTDGTIWGGEILLVHGASMQRLARLPRFPLPGGDRAAREPWRSALGLLFSVDPELARARGRAWIDDASLTTLLVALSAGVSAPLTSSVGRLFDAVAALAGRPERIAFEGQAAMQLEFAARRVAESAAYPLAFEVLRPNGEIEERGSFASFVSALLGDLAHGVALPELASKFQAGLVKAAAQVAKHAGCARVVLSGGCFQNQGLLTSLTRALEAQGQRVYCARQVPPNDGGIAAGQAAVAALGA
jgi:hydrogenase maturation protein HypF